MTQGADAPTAVAPLLALLQLERRAREAHPDGKVVVFSAFASPAVNKHCLGLGADAVFSKTDTAEFIQWLSRQRSP